MYGIVAHQHTQSNSYVEALTTNVTVFGDRISKEIIKVKWDYTPGALIQQE